MTDIHVEKAAKFYAANDMIIRWLREDRRRIFEPETTEFIRDIMAPAEGGIFLDVGAATGWFAIPVALQGREVVAVEANARVFERLKENMELNGLVQGEIETVFAAASDKAGEATFIYNHTLPLTSGGSLERPSSKGYRTEVVKTVRLDDLDLPKVRLIKIDVEEHERAVLEGAVELIKRYLPYLVLEANTEGHFAALGMWLKEGGYTWRRADERNMLCTPPGS